MWFSLICGDISKGWYTEHCSVFGNALLRVLQLHWVTVCVITALCGWFVWQLHYVAGSCDNCVLCRWWAAQLPGPSHVHHQHGGQWRGHHQPPALRDHEGGAQGVWRPAALQRKWHHSASSAPSTGTCENCFYFTVKAVLLCHTALQAFTHSWLRHSLVTTRITVAQMVFELDVTSVGMFLLGVLSFLLNLHSLLC